MRAEIEEFISNFKEYEKDGVLERTFTQGWCYWFGAILTERFCGYGAEMFYDPIQGHFVTRIGDRYYDIRGDVTDEVSQCRELYSEELCHEMPSIVRGCILKTKTPVSPICDGMDRKDLYYGQPS